MSGIVVAIGGNAISNPASLGDPRSQRANIRKVAREIADLYLKGEKIAVTHGNGPQVGRELQRNEIAAKLVPELPLYYLTAETESVIGSMVSIALSEELILMGKRPEICTVISHVIVENSKNPQMKPIGPLLSQAELESELSRGSFRYIKKGPKYRRIVPSPKPLRILESDMIKSLYGKGIVIAGGGGGVPMRMKGGMYSGVDAVIDKDLTSSILARDIAAQKLVILTDTDYLYSTNSRKAIKSVSIRSLEKMMGDLEEGTIRPKVQACIDFIKGGGRAAYIGNLYKLSDILAERSGTKIVK
ncbi:MAG: carbamate kinase [Candidatus Micrarchaeota archaeon]|nr:carbamate kinase [Candidatus Micrarchaeota archaeon]